MPSPPGARAVVLQGAFAPMAMEDQAGYEVPWMGPFGAVSGDRTILAPEWPALGTIDLGPPQLPVA